MSSKYVLTSLFLFGIFTIACVNDSKLEDESKDDKFQSEEEKYFEDYDVPLQKWGFIDKQGEIVINTIYDAVGKFSEGQAAANFKGKWGYIDKTGKTISDFLYKAAHPYRNGMAKVQTFEGKYLFLDQSGKPLETLDFTRAGDFEGTLAKVELSNRWGYIDKNGILVIEPAFEKAWGFKEGYAKVKSSGKYGLITSNGTFVLSPEFDRLSYPSDGIILAKKSDKYFYYDMKGNQLGGPYAGAIDFYDGVSFVNKDQMIQMMKIDEGRQSLRKLRCDDSVTSLPRYLGEGKWLVKGEQFYALMDKTGSLVTEFIYQQVNHYSDGIAAYRRGDLWGYLDNNGKELIDPVFGLAWDFSDQLARAAFRDGIAYINQKMEPPFIPRFRDMQNFTEGLAAVQEF